MQLCKWTWAICLKCHEWKEYWFIGIEFSSVITPWSGCCAGITVVKIRQCWDFQDYFTGLEWKRVDWRYRKRRLSELYLDIAMGQTWKNLCGETQRRCQRKLRKIKYIILAVNYCIQEISETFQKCIILHLRMIKWSHKWRDFCPMFLQKTL